MREMELRALTAYNRRFGGGSPEGAIEIEFLGLGYVILYFRENYDVVVYRVTNQNTLKFINKLPKGFLIECNKILKR